MTLHVNYSRKDDEAARVLHCPTCKCHRRMYAWYQEWYGWHVTCCTCGESWQDGEMAPRPFERGWRRRAAAKAGQNWRRIISGEREPAGEKAGRAS